MRIYDIVKVTETDSIYFGKMCIVTELGKPTHDIGIRQLFPDDDEAPNLTGGLQNVRRTAIWISPI